MAVQFLQAYDVYLKVKCRVKKLMLKALGWLHPNWRMLNCCPPCQYEVQGEPKLLICMLTCGDGNDTMKRVETHSAPEIDAEGKKIALGALKEWPDPRDGGEDYMLSQAEVDRWGKKHWTWKDGKARPDISNLDNLCNDK
ncbi:hypothetical protein Moror_11110 [Moniliophthora roreri MCA 2997]|nr:hypothetical protein Moror_11110 [Moniliophthora roreri MCA 2997]